MQGSLRETVEMVSSAPGSAMKRYFFDLGNKSEAIYDFRGHEVATLDAAYQLAELMALDLEVSEDWLGWVLMVRNPEGENIFSIPVRSADSVCR